MSGEDIAVWKRLAIIGLIVLALFMLSLLLCREWIKTDLRERGCEPLRIRWRPFGAWILSGPAFRVAFRDSVGNVMSADCGFVNWHRPVIWRTGPFSAGIPML